MSLPAFLDFLSYPWAMLSGYQLNQQTRRNGRFVTNVQFNSMITANQWLWLTFRFRKLRMHIISARYSGTISQEKFPCVVYCKIFSLTFAASLPIATFPTELMAERSRDRDLFWRLRVPESSLVPEAVAALSRFRQSLDLNLDSNQKPQDPLQTMAKFSNLEFSMPLQKTHCLRLHLTQMSRWIEFEFFRLM